MPQPGRLPPSRFAAALPSVPSGTDGFTPHGIVASDERCVQHRESEAQLRRPVAATLGSWGGLGDVEITPRLAADLKSLSGGNNKEEKAPTYKSFAKSGSMSLASAWGAVSNRLRPGWKDTSAACDEFSPDGILASAPYRGTARQVPLDNRRSILSLIAGFTNDPGKEAKLAADVLWTDLQEQFYWLKPIFLLAFLGYMVFVATLILRLLRYKGAVEPASIQSVNCRYKLACPINTTCIYDAEVGDLTCQQPAEKRVQDTQKAYKVQHMLLEALGVGLGICIAGVLVWCITPRCIKCFKLKNGHLTDELDESTQSKKRRKKYKSFGTGELQQEIVGLTADDDVHRMALRILANGPPSSPPRPLKSFKDPRRNKKRTQPRQSKPVRQPATKPKRPRKAPEPDDVESSEDSFDDLFATRESPEAKGLGRAARAHEAYDRDQDVVSRWSYDAFSDSEASEDVPRKIARSLRRVRTMNTIDGSSEASVADEYFSVAGPPNFMGYALRLAATCDGAGRRNRSTLRDSDDSLDELEPSKLAELFHPPL